MQIQLLPSPEQVIISILEVDSITGLQIIDRSIRGDDIAGSAN